MGAGFEDGSTLKLRLQLYPDYSILTNAGLKFEIAGNGPGQTERNQSYCLDGLTDKGTWNGALCLYR
jgi:hypothetical protein